MNNITPIDHKKNPQVKPSTLDVNLMCVPDYLKLQNRWVLRKLKYVKVRWTKAPDIMHLSRQLYARTTDRCPDCSTMPLIKHTKMVCDSDLC